MKSIKSNYCKLVYGKSYKAKIPYERRCKICKWVYY